MIRTQMTECLPNVHKAWNTFVIPALEVGDRRIIFDFTVIQGQPGILSKNLITKKIPTWVGLGIEYTVSHIDIPGIF